MTDVVIRTEGLVKDYGDVRALAGVDLAVERGEIFGFIGPNGAGKSTTIRVLMDLLRPTEGRAEVLGLEPREGGPRVRSRVGYLPGELNMGGRRTAGGLLGHLADMRGGAGRDRIPELAERLRLDLDRPIGGLSKGNKQKIGVVQAFMHEPEVLILDEPTSGLDPLLQHECLELIEEASKGGATVFMSSHVLSEVEDVAGRVAIIRAGRILDIDDVATLRHHAGQEVELVFDEPVAAEAFEGLEGVHDVSVDRAGDGAGEGAGDAAGDVAGEGTRLTCLLRGEPDALLKAAAQHHVVAWSAQDRELEDLFLDFYRQPVVGSSAEDDRRSRRPAQSSPQTGGRR